MDATIGADQSSMVGSPVTADGATGEETCFPLTQFLTDGYRPRSVHTVRERWQHLLGGRHHASWECSIRLRKRNVCRADWRFLPGAFRDVSGMIERHPGTWGILFGSALVSSRCVSDLFSVFDRF